MDIEASRIRNRSSGTPGTTRVRRLCDLDQPYGHHPLAPYHHPKMQRPPPGYTPEDQHRRGSHSPLDNYTYGEPTSSSSWAQSSAPYQSGCVCQPASRSTGYLGRTSQGFEQRHFGAQTPSQPPTNSTLTHLDSATYPRTMGRGGSISFLQPWLPYTHDPCPDSGDSSNQFRYGWQ